MNKPLNKNVALAVAKFKALQAAGLPDITDDPEGVIHDAVANGLLDLSNDLEQDPLVVEFTCSDLPTMEFPVCGVAHPDWEDGGGELHFEAHPVGFERSLEPTKVLFMDPVSGFEKGLWVWHFKVTVKVELEEE